MTERLEQYAQLMRERKGHKGPYRRMRLLGQVERKPVGRAVRIRDIHPEVLIATADELIAHGWGEVTRDKIPVDWRRRA